MDFQRLQAIDRDIGLFMAIVREILSQRLVEEICDDQITVGQVRCLCFILAQERVTVGDISRGLGISYPAATKAVSRLVEKGLTARKSDAADRRSIFVEITPAGLELTGKVKPEKLKRLGSILDKLSHEEMGFLHRGILAFLSAATDDAELSGQICLHCGKEHVQECILNSLKFPARSSAVGK